MKFSLVAILMMACAVVFAQNPGDFDPSFGTNGVMTFDIGNSFDMGYAAVQQADGKILTTGRGRINDDYSIYVSRHNEDGSLDAAFGTNGIVTFKPTPYIHFAYDIELLGDKILVAGYTYHVSSGKTCPYLMCLNEDGSLNANFKDGGFSLIDDGHAMVPKHITIKDEMIYWAGYRDDLATVARFFPDGNLDTSFGEGGYVMMILNEGFGSNCEDVAIQEDGKIVSASWYLTATDYDCALVRMNQDGSYDETFGEGGMKKFTIGSGVDFLMSVEIAPDGKIVAGGHYWIENDPRLRYGAAVMRFNEDGSFDTSFGENGFAKIEYVKDGENYMGDVAVDEYGRIYSGCWYRNNSDQHMFIWALNSNGSAMPNFGENGMVSFGGDEDECFDADILADGKVLILGHDYYQIIMARFLTSISLGVADGTLSTDAIQVYPNPSSDFVTVSFQGQQNYDIIDLNGRVVKSGVGEGQTTIDLTQMTAGTYILVVTDQRGGYQLGKFMKL